MPRRKMFWFVQTEDGQMHTVESMQSLKALVESGDAKRIFRGYEMFAEKVPVSKTKLVIN